ncbi:murein transglycosylase A [Rhizobium sp. PAMB 3174]
MTEGQDFELRPVSFADLPRWQEDDPSSLAGAMRACLTHLKSAKPYKTGSLGLNAGDLVLLLEQAERLTDNNPQTWRAFFEATCEPFLIRRRDGERGFVTAFYEPEVEVSAVADETYRFPLYRRPDDMVDVSDANRPADMDAYYEFGLLSDGAISCYPDRGEIERGYLDGRGLEIAWAKSRADVFFTHVQGAARLRYPDGSLKRITYAAKAGHRFSGIGKLLIERGEIAREAISMQSIRAWLEANPDRADEVYWQNRSYIFFREAAVDDVNQGPIAAAKVPLVAGRSLAVDRRIHTFGFPFYIVSEAISHMDDAGHFARLMLALDTGSAITGPARGDIFTGSGDEAGEMAGAVACPADFYILVPKAAAARYR